MSIAVILFYTSMKKNRNKTRRELVVSCVLWLNSGWKFFSTNASYIRPLTDFFMISRCYVILHYAYLICFSFKSYFVVSDILIYINVCVRTWWWGYRDFIKHNNWKWKHIENLKNWLPIILKLMTVIRQIFCWL